MLKSLWYAAYGWLVFIAVGHFAADVVSQYLRGKRAPSPETTLYYGLNTAYALGQLLFGLLALWLVRHSIELIDRRPIVLLSLAAAACWLAIAFFFMEYWEPKLAAAVFGALVIAAAAAP